MARHGWRTRGPQAKIKKHNYNPPKIIRQVKAKVKEELLEEEEQKEEQAEERNKLEEEKEEERRNKVRK